eukprot:Gb_07769 [translate_table: standard]
MATLMMGLCMKMPITTSLNQRSFFKGSTHISIPSNSTSISTTTSHPSYIPVRALKKIQGKVVCATSDKTVSVEVVRLAPHPKYKKRIRIKRKFQAHDPENKFKVGDLVQLNKCAPVSKTKAFLALPVPPRKSSPKVPAAVPEELSLPLESATA